MIPGEIDDEKDHGYSSATAAFGVKNQKIFNSYNNWMFNSYFEKFSVQIMHNLGKDIYLPTNDEF